jgi:hypothetical protein
MAKTAWVFTCWYVLVFFRGFGHGDATTAIWDVNPLDPWTYGLMPSSEHVRRV